VCFVEWLEDIHRHYLLFIGRPIFNIVGYEGQGEIRRWVLVD